MIREPVSHDSGFSGEWRRLTCPEAGAGVGAPVVRFVRMSTPEGSRAASGTTKGVPPALSPLTRRLLPRDT